MDKRTLVLGASPNPDRFSYKAMRSLQRRNIEFVSAGLKEAVTEEFTIHKGIPPKCGPIHTVTLYMSAKHQKDYYKQILDLNPKRIIFNPGTANPELESLATSKGINCVNDCMLIMLSNGNY